MLLHIHTSFVHACQSFKQDYLLGGGGGGGGRDERMEGRIDYCDLRLTLIKSCHKVTELTTGTTKGCAPVAVA